MPPLFERPWNGWNLPVKPFQTELLPPEDGEADPVETAFVSKYLELADILLRSGAEAAEQPRREPVRLPLRAA